MPETIGQQLSAARKGRDLTIEDVAHKTRIHRDVVCQLEADDHSAFPNLMFLKSFLKIYSEHLQVDASEAITQLAAGDSNHGDSNHGDQYLLGGISPAIRERFGHLTYRIPMRPILATAAAAAMLVLGGSYLVNHLYGQSGIGSGKAISDEIPPSGKASSALTSETPAETPTAEIKDPDLVLVPKTRPVAPVESPLEPPPPLAPDPAIPKASPVKKALPVTAEGEPEQAATPEDYEPSPDSPDVVTPED